MRILIVSNLIALDSSDEGKDRNLTVLFDGFHQDCDGDEHVDASHASAMADSRYPPPSSRGKKSKKGGGL